METEPEWRLYENLRAAGIEFRVEAGTPGIVNAKIPEGGQGGQT